MSKSQFSTPLSVVRNPGTHLLMVGDNKDGSQTLYSYSKHYDVKPADMSDKVEFDASQAGVKVSLAGQTKSWFLVMLKEFVEVYSLDKATGKLNKMCSFQADFDKQDPRVNAAIFAYGNQYIITGGNDTVIRAWKLDINKEFDTVTGAQSIRQFTSHKTPIQHIDLTFDHQLLASIASEDEKVCLIHDFSTASLVNELTFSEQCGQDNMAFRGWFFSLHKKYLYTLVSDVGKNSYVTKWDAKSREFHNLTTIKIHKGLCTKFGFSNDGFYLTVGSDNGFIKSINTRYMQSDRNDKHHDHSITCLDFTSDTRFIISWDNKGNYWFIPNIRAPGYMRFFFQGLMAVMLFFYIYRCIMEAYFE